MTCLISIGDIKVVDVTTKHLRNWALREKMGTRAGSKSETCVAIANFVKQHRRMKAKGIDTQHPEEVYARGKMNFVRVVNVFAIETFKAKLACRGTQIGRTELDEGVRADEDLWKEFASHYNDLANEDLDELKYEVDWKGMTPDPSSFTDIDWKKGETAFKDMSAKYDIAHKKWKQSGFHGGKCRAFNDSVSVLLLIFFIPLQTLKASRLQTLLDSDGYAISMSS